MGDAMLWAPWILTLLTAVPYCLVARKSKAGWLWGLVAVIPFLGNFIFWTLVAKRVEAE